MKKNLLFVINDLRIGGAEKCLVSLLHEIDYEKYNVDVFLFRHQGALLKKLPSKVNLLPEDKNYYYFDSSIKNAILENIKTLNIRFVIDRIRFGFINNSKNSSAIKEQINWKFMKNHLRNLSKNYDAAFGFLEKKPNYFVIDKTKAKKKILSVMTDYEALGMSKTIDFPYFEKADYITVLSEENLQTMHRVFPEFIDKTMILENMISAKEIIQNAEEKIKDFPQNVFTIVSVGRLNPVKLHEIGLEVMKILKEKKLAFNWLIIGDGESRNRLEEKIKIHGLENYITILGEKDNPYPYIKKADIFLHLSKFEGYGIAIAEARILKKCVVLNDFTTASTHIKNGFDGIISPLNPQKIADEIEKLMFDENLRKKYEQNVSFDKDFAQRILRKIDNIIEN